MNDKMKKDAFLKSVKTALRDKPERTVESAFAPIAPEEDIYTGGTDKKSLLKRLMEQAGPINLKVYPVKNVDEAGKAIAELVENTTPDPVDLLDPNEKQVVGWDHPLVDALDLENRLKEKGARYVRTTLETPTDAPKKDMRETIIASYIGVTSADYCVAETGTLVMKTAENQPRSASLAPAIHVAVVKEDQLVPDLRSLYKILRKELDVDENAFTKNMTFITGPSKTGDIELVIVFGVHGPKEVHLFVLEE